MLPPVEPDPLVSGAGLPEMYQSWAKGWKISFNKDSERREKLLPPRYTHLGWLRAPAAVKGIDLEVLTIFFRGLSSLRTDKTLGSVRLAPHPHLCPFWLPLPIVTTPQSRSLVQILALLLEQVTTSLCPKFL